MTFKQTLLFVVASLACSSLWAAAAQVPAWVQAQVSAPLPAVDAETSAVLMYSETVFTVKGPGKIERHGRKVYRILREEGSAFGTVRVDFDAQNPVTLIKGWSIPAQGKPYEVGQKEVIESTLAGMPGGELITDMRSKLMRIPAATVGSVIGYEVRQEQRPYVLADDWNFQETVPVREASYTLYLPPDWSHKAFWLNHPEQQPVPFGKGGLQWRVSDVKPIALEELMPPWQGIAANMAVSLLPPGGQDAGFQSWREMGTWYLGLTQGRRDASPEIGQKVRELTASLPQTWEKIRALSTFVQKDIRYVAIELGIGGLQPHSATEVFTHRYGDCKDKVTLLSSMLKEIGIDSHYVIINTRRGSVTENTPPNLGFNHVIIAIQIPPDQKTEALPALATHPKLGKVLYFDPTQTLIPFGQLPGGLQANYGMLVTPEGGELRSLPQSTPETNGVTRTAKLTLDENGTLRGDVVESWTGDRGAEWRETLRAASREADRIRRIESMLSHSLGTFQLVKSAVTNQESADKPLEWRYTLEATRYAKKAGDLLLVRPRVFGGYSTPLLEKEKPRKHPVEFEALERNTDVFEIALPAGYVIEEMPEPVDTDAAFAAYRSKIEMQGNVLRYTRTFEIKQLSVPAAKSEELRKLLRVVYADERTTAVLTRSP